MTNQTVELGLFSFKQSAFMGAKLGLKLALGYAAFISVLLGIVALNPLVLLSAAFYALFIGLIPAILTGTIAGVLFYVLFVWLGDDLSEWKITAVGWAVGIPFALILIALVAWGTLGINATYLEFIEAVKGLSFLLLCQLPSLFLQSAGWQGKSADWHKLILLNRFDCPKRGKHTILVQNLRLHKASFA